MRRRRDDAGTAIVSLVVFSGKDNPRRVAVDDVDDRWTPQSLFDELNAVHGFTVDVAASAANAKCTRFHTRDDDGIAQSWADEVVWCNPPYSNLLPWVVKARAETTSGTCRCVVMLIPANRTEQRFWQDHIEPYRDRPGSGVSTEFRRGRDKFYSPTARASRNPPFGCVIITFSRPGAVGDGGGAMIDEVESGQKGAARLRANGDPKKKYLASRRPSSTDDADRWVDYRTCCFVAVADAVVAGEPLDLVRWFADEHDAALERMRALGQGARFGFLRDLPAGVWPMSGFHVEAEKNNATQYELDGAKRRAGGGTP